MAASGIDGAVKFLIHAIVALAFFIQAMIPMGFMPNAHASSEGTALVICSGLDIKTVYLDDNGKEIPSGHKKKVDAPCLYSGQTISKSPESFKISSDVITYEEAIRHIWLSRSVQQDKFLKPPAIGPPVLL